MYIKNVIRHKTECAYPDCSVLGKGVSFHLLPLEMGFTPSHSCATMSSNLHLFHSHTKRSERHKTVLRNNRKIILSHPFLVPRFWKLLIAPRGWSVLGFWATSEILSEPDKICSGNTESKENTIFLLILLHLLMTFFNIRFFNWFWVSWSLPAVPFHTAPHSSASITSEKDKTWRGHTGGWSCSCGTTSESFPRG